MPSRIPQKESCLRFGSTIPNFFRQFSDAKSESRLAGIGLNNFQTGKLIPGF